MFQSRTVMEHILRGVAGFGLVVVAVVYSSQLGWWTLAPLAGALVSFRGCPMCWTVGLVERIVSGKAANGCVDGSCTAIEVARTASSEPR